MNTNEHESGQQLRFGLAVICVHLCSFVASHRIFFRTILCRRFNAHRAIKLAHKKAATVLTPPRLSIRFGRTTQFEAPFLSAAFSTLCPPDCISCPTPFVVLHAGNARQPPTTNTNATIIRTIGTSFGFMTTCRHSTFHQIKQQS
jgi:hypothetical protein